MLLISSRGYWSSARAYQFSARDVVGPVVLFTNCMNGKKTKKKNNRLDQSSHLTSVYVKGAVKRKTEAHLRHFLRSA